MGTYSLMGPVQSVAAASDASSKLRNVRCASQSARGNVARIHALGGGFLQADIEGGRQAGEPELFQRGDELRMVHGGKGIR